MSFYTYMHTRNDTNETFYIGKGHGKRAFWKHGRNQHWENIVNKHGYTVHLLAEWEKEADAFEHEKFLISCFRAMNKNLVNRTDGGDGPIGQKFSDDAKQKMRLVWKEKYLQGYKNPKGMLGKVHSETTKEKMKNSHALRDCSMPENIKEKIAISSIGKPPTLGMEGKSHSEETKQKIALARKGKPWTETRRLAQKKG